MQPPILYKNRGSCYFSPLYYGGFCRRSSYWECKRKFSGIYVAIQLFWQWAYFLCRLSRGRYGKKDCFAYLCRAKKRRLDNRGRRQLLYCCKRRLGITIPSCGADLYKEQTKRLWNFSKAFLLPVSRGQGGYPSKKRQSLSTKADRFLGRTLFCTEQPFVKPLFFQYPYQQNP